jgi:PKD repeat protein
MLKIIKFLFQQLLMFAWLCTLQKVNAQLSIGSSPKNGAYLSDQIVNLECKTVISGFSYHFQVSTDTLITQLVLDTIVSDNGFFRDFGSSNQRYFWRVKASHSQGITEWSDTYKFNIFSPDRVDNLVLWLSSESLSLSDNSPVEVWTDLSGNGFDASQTNALLRPIYRGFGGVSNRPYVDFDGTDGMVTAVNRSNIPNDSTLTFVSLQRNRNQGYGALFYLGNSGSFSPQYAARTAGSSYNNGSLRFLGYNGGAFAFDLQSTNGQFRIISGFNNLLQAKLFSNGSLAANSGSGLVSVAAGATLKIGCNQDFTENYSGLLHELLVFRNLESDSLLRDLERFINWKYVPAPELGDNIIQYQGFCDSMVTLSPGIGYTQYLWSTGATSPSIAVSDFGVYSVIVTDEFGMQKTDKIEVRPNEVLGYPSVPVICQGSSLLWDTGISGHSVQWSDGFNGVSRTITSPGSYYYDVVDGNGCTYRSDTINIQLDSYPLIPYLGADTSLCTGNFLALQVGAFQTVSYSWQDGSTAAQFAVNAPGTYWVQTSNANGCIARDTILISIAGTAPNAEFSVTDHCFNKLVPLLDQSSGVGADFVAQWQWNMGNGTVLNQQAPNYTYPAPGTYSVQLYVQSIGGCGAYHYDTVIVFANPEVSYDVVGHCEDQEVIFTNTTSAGSAAISSYTWDFDMPWTGAYNTSNIPIPNRVFEQVGNYDVKLVVTDANGCKDSLIQTVVIDPSPVPNFIFESTCQGTPIQFINTSTTQPSSTYLWEFGDNTSSILVNPQHSYPDYGLQQVVLSVTNLYGCTASNLQEVEVYAFPEVSMQIGSACVDSYVTLENTSLVPLGAIDSTLWVINQTDTLYGLNSAWMVDVFGQQQVELFTWSAQGCASQSSQFFDVTTQFNADFTTGTGIIAVGQPFTFENTSTPGSIALWTFGDGGFSTEYSPEHTFSSAYADSSLEVMLIALDPSGCIDTSMQTVLIRRARIDLEIANLFLQKDGNWYTMGVSLTNKGTVNIESADLVVETQKGLLFNETWHGSLEPTEDSVYVFSAMPTSIFNDQDNIEAYICVSGVGFDLYNTAETYLENNRVCRNVEGEDIVLLPVFPNPATGDFNVRIFLTNPAEVYLSLDDSRGRSVVLMENNTSLQDGYYQYNVDADRLAEGIYYIHLRSGEETKTFRLSVIK